MKPCHQSAVVADETEDCDGTQLETTIIDIHLKSNKTCILHIKSLFQKLVVHYKDMTLGLCSERFTL